MAEGSRVGHERHVVGDAAQRRTERNEHRPESLEVVCVAGVSDVEVAA